MAPPPDLSAGCPTSSSQAAPVQVTGRSAGSGGSIPDASVSNLADPATVAPAPVMLAPPVQDFWSPVLLSSYRRLEQEGSADRPYAIVQDIFSGHPLPSNIWPLRRPLDGCLRF